MEIPFLQSAAKAEPKNHSESRHGSAQLSGRGGKGDDFSAAYDAGSERAPEKLKGSEETAAVNPETEADASEKAPDAHPEGSVDGTDATDEKSRVDAQTTAETGEDLDALMADDTPKEVAPKSEKVPLPASQHPAEMAFRHRLVAERETGTGTSGKVAEAAGTDLPAHGGQLPGTAGKAAAAGNTEQEVAGAKTAVAQTNGLMAENVSGERDRRAVTPAADTEATKVPTMAQDAGKGTTPQQQTLAATSAEAVRKPTVDAGRREARDRGSETLRSVESSPPKQMPRQTPNAGAAGGAPLRPLDATKVQQGESKLFDLQQIDGVEQEISFHREARSATPSSLAQVLARAETPAMIGRQMAEILHRFPDRPVELALNPKELGKVRLSISATDAGVTVSVLAERQETLDLMRRHIHELAREFQDIGYGTVSFAFSEGSSGGDAKSEDGGAPAQNYPAVPDETAEPEGATLQLVASEGLDIRL